MVTTGRGIAVKVLGAETALEQPAAVTTCAVTWSPLFSTTGPKVLALTPWGTPFTNHSYVRGPGTPLATSAVKVTGEPTQASGFCGESVT